MGAFYLNSVVGFLKDNPQRIVGILTEKGGIAGFHQQLHSQTRSWGKEIDVLQHSLSRLSAEVLNIGEWHILLEYPIVRREKRIDAVLITGSCIMVIEFKVGATEYYRNDEEQLLDYCLDLRDFHFESRGRRLVPLLVATEAADRDNSYKIVNELVQPIVYANRESLSRCLLGIATVYSHDSKIDAGAWNNSQYAPTPTIIEAARVLFAGHSVEDITKSHSDITNLTATTDAVVNAINIARKNKEKIICFITGVPGAGKTLAGLHIAHHPDFQTEDTSLATFLSGNGPLIKVLRAALSRDAYKRHKAADPGVKKKEQERIIAFIENVHRFIDGYFSNKDLVPNNKIVIFDEAQRAWNAEQSKRKFDRDFSEPEMMFDIMDRHSDWAVIVALIGGGQEINTGEAGLREWGNNLQAKYPHWKVYVSPQLETGNHSTANLTLFEQPNQKISVTRVPELHLDVAIRSYKAERLSEWVHLVLSNRADEAQELFIQDLKDYPIVITRDLDSAREWLVNKCQGTRRMGLVASSGGRRLRKHGLDVKAELEEEHWFLNDREDVRSSYALEVPATEFGIQGLELDWTGVCWDLDLRRANNTWEFKAFKGTSWYNVNAEDMRQYITNKYRVLLTRAREGMVIFIPHGDVNDKTAPGEHYDAIFSYLTSCGIPELN